MRGRVYVTRSSAIGAALAVGALLLAACTPPEDPATPDDGATGENRRVTGINVAGDRPFYSYNNQSSLGAHAANTNVIYLTSSTFNYYDGDAQLVRNEDFGTYEVVGEDPLQVRYTVNDGVTWSDGTPIDAADLLLYWVANSGARNTEGFRPERDESGRIVPAGEDTVYFDGQVGNGLHHVSQVPEIGPDGRSVTLTYDEMFVDWELVFWSGVVPGLPAHVVARHALGIEDPEQAKDAVVAAIQDNDTGRLHALADFWNTGFTFGSLPEDESLYLSSGPYVLSELVADQYLTVVRNPEYDWGPQPALESITIRYLDSPMAAVSALRNREVDLIAPQPTADVRTALEGLEGIEWESAVDITYEHLDLNFAHPRHDGVFDDPRVREAFLKTVPRQEIVDRLIRPLQPDAEVRDSQLLSPPFPGYERMVEENGSAAFAEVDIDGARDLLAEAGEPAPQVCVLYDSSNPRRVNTFQLIEASAESAGFVIEDCGDPNWSALLEQEGTFDAAIFGWQSATTAVTSGSAKFRTGGVNNYGGYSNEQVDELFDELESTTDPERQLDLQVQIEQHLWADHFGLPLYQFPAITAWHESVDGVDTSPLAPTIFWNFWEWEITSPDGD